jgi:hypothetical protein
MTGPETNRDSDLARIDEALSEGRARADDPRERELQELALALQADAPEPEPGFAGELNARVEGGFEKAAGGRRRFRLSLPRLRLAPALGVAAMLIAVAVVAIGVLGRGDSPVDRTASAPRATTTAVPPISGIVEGDEQAQVAPSPVQPSPGGSSDSARGSNAGERRVERTADLTLASPEGKMQSVADGVGAVAERYHGFVVRSEVTTGDKADAGGTFVLRVPTNRLESALADLAKLGDVRARSQTGQDMTAPFRSVESQLANALLERSAVRERLKSAKGKRAESLRIRLHALQQKIDALGNRMHELRRRTLYSTVTITLEKKKGGAGAGAGKRHGDGTGAAFDDAVDTLLDVVNFLVRALGVLIPLGLLAALSALGFGVLRRRRREAALF